MAARDPRISSFSLIELILVLSLIVLLSGIVVISIESIFKGFDSKPLPKILKQSVRQTRFLAAANKEAAYLSFDWETSDFVIQDERGAVLERIETGYPGEDPSLHIKFFQILPLHGYRVGTGLAPEEKEVSRVAFHPDRSSTPFSVTLKYDSASSRHRYDPFSDVEIEESNR